MASEELSVRRVAFEYPDDFDPRWHPALPELACVANAVSLLMPHAEPYVVKSVRTAVARVDDAELAAEAKAYLAQELQHHKQHRRFNELVVAAEPGLARIDRWMARVFAWLHRRRSDAFNAAFAAGFETVAYCAARWTEARLGRLLDGADEVPATLFLWHLAEEVEHKTVAFDVYRAAHGSRRTYVAGMVVSAVLLAVFTTLGTIHLLFRQGRLFRPVAHWRMATWSIGFAFELLPAMAVSALPGHHPSRLVDPSFYAHWLAQYDDETGTIPVWNFPTEVRASRSAA